MQQLNNHLIQYLREQIALEEHLCVVLGEQIERVDEDNFSDVKQLLVKTKDVLERHFGPLNKLLDSMEIENQRLLQNPFVANGAVTSSDKHLVGQQGLNVSRMLRDDYSALNLITISNTLLHTTALALGSSDVALLALTHLHNLAPLVIKLGEFVPETVARELYSVSATIDRTIGALALENAKQAWRQ